MQCLHPHTRTYVDPVSGQTRVCTYPCGKCIACLHNFQDSWSIRIGETAKAYGSFIYDTLTFKPSALPMREVSSEEVSLFDEVPSCHYRNYIDRSTGLLCVPFVDRSLIRDWIRRARELFVYDHGFRPKWKYIVFMEMGPKTSRPHFHLLFFGISHADYVKYLAVPWRESNGFTCTKFIDGKDRKHRQCISRYVSKYCSKGVFESPLVKFGLCLKPFRCISHGIGEEYLSKSVFDWFKNVLPQFWRSITVDKSKDSSTWARSEHIRYLLAHDFMEGFKNPPSEVLDALSCYHDEGGFSHSLPRYYKYKLLGLFTPNLLSYAIQNLLLARSELLHRKALAEFARSKGLSVVEPRCSTSLLGLSRKSFDLLDNIYFTFQRREAFAKAKRRFTELKNHYLRPLRDKAYAWAC